MRMSIELIGPLRNLPPLPRGLDAAHSTQLLSGELQRSVRVALDFVSGAGPSPRGVPGDVAIAGRVQAGTLLAGGIAALAPEVVVQDVTACLDSTPLVAEVCAACEGLSRNGSGIAYSCQRQREGCERCEEGLHFDFEMNRQA